MYAQCPECLTFFHLKPAHLKAAQGRVRCSQCKHVFNALETLRDELTPEEIAEVEAARRLALKKGERQQDEDQVGDLFDGLEYTENADLGLDEPEPAPAGAAEVDIRPVDAPAALARDIEEFTTPRQRPRHPVLLALANLVLLVLLVAQLVHAQRFQLAQHPVAGQHLERLYAALGHPIQPPADLAALQISRTEVSSNPELPRALLLTAALENTAEHPQPWPELHVDLQDRWGDTVGARYFSPHEYLRDPAAAEQALLPGARAAIQLAIADPGSAAVGFQIEPCFRNGERYVCPGDLKK